jgi:hypothetical protein
MPHIGHAPGRSLATPSHMGQKYFAGCAGVFAVDEPEEE